MTEYGRFINGQLVRNKNGKTHEDDKEIIYTDIPTLDFVCFFHWEEQADKIVQVWTQTNRPVPQNEKAEISDYENALSDMGVRFGD